MRIEEDVLPRENISGRSICVISLCSRRLILYDLPVSSGALAHEYLLFQTVYYNFSEKMWYNICEVLYMNL
jgi:hypothetical protein